MTAQVELWDPADSADASPPSWSVEVDGNTSKNLHNASKHVRKRSEPKGEEGRSDTEPRNVKTKALESIEDDRAHLDSSATTSRAVTCHIGQLLERSATTSAVKQVK